MRPIGRFLCWCSALGVALASTVVAAQSRQDEEAKTHFRSGSVYFDRGDYENAAREFRQAYELSQRPQLQYNLYLAYERLGRLDKAADALEHYLREVENVPRRESLEARLERLRERAKARQEAAASPDAGPGSPEPGSRGTPAGGAAEPQASAAEGGERSGSVHPAAWAAFGVGAAGLVTFAVAGGMALGEDNDLASSCGADAGRTCSGADVARLERLNRTADVGLALGLAGAATGTILYFLIDQDGAEDRSVSVVPYGSLTGAGASASVRF